MKKIFFTIISFSAAALLLALTKKPAIINERQGIVVMELFTSQSCSSCPKADDLLGRYAEKNDAHIIPIAFHVDYWNQLGWRDSFSNSQYSMRQEWYNEKFLHASVYTPQLVVNGNKELVGNDETKVKAAIENALNEAATTTISVTNQTILNNQLQLQYTLDGATANTILNVAVIQHKTITKIKGGENGGVTLANYNVVRSFVTSPATASGTSFIKLPVGINTNELSVVLYAQNNKTGKITGAIKKAL